MVPPPVICSALTSLKKKDGNLIMTDQQLTWTPKAGAAGKINIALESVGGLFASKATSPKIALRLDLTSNEASSSTTGGVGESLTFVFINASSALSDREKFKAELTKVVSRNRSTVVGGGQQTRQGTPAAAGVTLGGTSGATSPKKDLKGKGKQKEQRSSTPSISSPRPETSGPSTTNQQQQDQIAIPEWQVRKSVLQKDESLERLHKELVRGGVLGEDEFWEGREHILSAERLLLGQQTGRIAKMVDPRPSGPSTNQSNIRHPTKSGGGDDEGKSDVMTIKVSAQMVHDIFEMYPVVRRIYAERVPKELSETAFWQRYFQSKLFYQHHRSYSASSASTSLTSNPTGSSTSANPGRFMASMENIRPDNVFDKYLGEEDDDIEPKHLTHEDVFSLLDLRSTEEDHGETGNQSDFTMRAGSQRGSLPLIRRFNEHSERLLDQALGQQTGVRTGRIDGGDAGSRLYYDEILLTDLEDQVSLDRVPLNVNQKAASFRGGTKGNDEGEGKQKQMDGDEDEAGPAKKRRRLDGEGTAEIFRETKRVFEDWVPDLGELEINSSATRDATEHMMTNMRGRWDRSARDSRDVLPSDLFRQIISCQASANEFLRQFWSSVLPPPLSTTPASATTPQQKVAKAERMIKYLEGTDERVGKVVEEAGRWADGEVGGVEEVKMKERVAKALESTQKAVQKAMDYYKTRTASSTSTLPVMVSTKTATSSVSSPKTAKLPPVVSKTKRSSILPNQSS